MTKSRIALGCLPPLVVLVILVALNATPGEQERIWHGAMETAFDEPRGWPFTAVAVANEDGATEVRASIVQNDVRLKRNVYEGDYPHLAWHPFAIGLNIVVALVLVVAAGGIPLLLSAWRSKESTPRGPPGSSA